ncbi:MAG: hypothetical protein WC334_03015 [Kiritimatiellales bacterium]|jgi:tetratricopeptide (TPR) repeat protein
MSVLSKLTKIFKFHFHLLCSGSFLNFYRISFANNKTPFGQKITLKYAPALLRQAEEGSVEHQTALESISEVYMRQHRFEEAANGFQSALNLLSEHSTDFHAVKHSASYLFTCLAACHFNLGNREKTVEVIKEALRVGVPVDSFEGLIDVKKLRETMPELRGKVDSRE